MKKLIENIENNTMRKYGFEARVTIATCKATEIIRKLFNIGY